MVQLAADLLPGRIVRENRVGGFTITEPDGTVVRTEDDVSYRKVLLAMDGKVEYHDSGPDQVTIGPRPA
jgi:hypothetical protein